MEHPSRKAKLKHATPMVMKVRESRLPEIIDIISHQTIRSQEELSKQLAIRGFIITQATLSRDLKLIKASKMPDENGICRYFVGPPQTTAHGAAGKSSAQTSPTSHSAVISLAVTGNLLVIKTRNGYASGLAYEIDLMQSPIVLGTISGADTVFVALAENTHQEAILDLLRPMIAPNLLESIEQQP